MREETKTMNIKIQHSQGFLAIYFCCLAVSCVLASRQVKSEELAEELVFFRQEGAYSPYKFVQVLIRNDGSGATTFERTNKETGSTSFHLNQHELETFKTLVCAVDFFSQPAKDTRMVVDVGRSILRISLGGKKRELHFEFRPEIGPLTSCLWKLIHQGVILTDLRNKGDVYPELGGVSDLLASAKVFQPEVLREPLQKFVISSDDRQKLLWAIEALSWITIPEEWMGFLALELERSQATRRSVLLEALSSHPFTGNIPKTHREMLCPLFLRYLRLEYRNWSGFPKEKRQAYGSVIRFLGSQRYTISTPVLVQMVEECYTDYDSWLGWSLPHMAGEAIEPLRILLDSPKVTVRAGAAEMLGKILTMDQPPPNNTISQQERDQILKRLRSTVTPHLERLSKHDPESWVRKAAERSLQQIERGWNK